MSSAHPSWTERERQRWLRPDWQRWMRPDAWRFAAPGSTESARPGWLDPRARPRSAVAEAKAHAEHEAFERELLELRRDFAALKREIALSRLQRKYSPDQPRVPKGNPDGGQWSGDGSKKPGTPDFISEPAAMRPRRERPRPPGRLPRGVTEWLVEKVETAEEERARVNRLANEAIDRVRRVDEGWQPRPSLYESDVEGDIRKAKDLVLEAEARLVELGYQSPQQLIEIYRAQRNSPTLFPWPSWPFDKDVVGVTILDRLPIFGTNSDAPPYTSEDRRAADVARDKAIAENPELARKNLGWIPMDGLYHAETTTLLRAARANGGSLEGRTFEIHVDARMCDSSCQKVLPIVGRQVGNPTVIFIDKFGTRNVLRGGRWD